jgi:tetratricopeptide (TPR) repeat protein
MLRLERRQSPSRWRERHRNLADANRAWRQEQFADVAWEDDVWRSLRLEEMYHGLCADLGASLPAALSAIVEACANQPAAVPQIAQTITQAGHDTDVATLLTWGRQLEDAIRPGGFEGTASSLTLVLADGLLPDGLRELALRARGRAMYYLDRDAEAIADLDQVLALMPDDSYALAYRGAAHMFLEDTDKALIDLDRAIELDPDNSWAVSMRSEVYRLIAQGNRSSTRGVWHVGPNDVTAPVGKNVGGANLHVSQSNAATAGERKPMDVVRVTRVLSRDITDDLNEQQAASTAKFYEVVRRHPGGRP